MGHSITIVIHDDQSKYGKQGADDESDNCYFFFIFHKFPFRPMGVSVAATRISDEYN